MLEALGEMVECAICSNIMDSEIKLCQQGHSMCGSCASKVKECPFCKSYMTQMRNFKLEQLIGSLKQPNIMSAFCKYAVNGCKLTLDMETTLKSHERECGSRNYSCEGKRFAEWNCEWEGKHFEIYDHFLNNHKEYICTRSEFSKLLKINFETSFSTLRLIILNANMQKKKLFWFKVRSDVQKQKVYLLFQFIGSKKEAEKYLYVFTIVREAEPIHYLKIKNQFENDSEDFDEIAEQERCIIFSLNLIKRFLNSDNKIRFDFKIRNLQN